MCTIFMYMDALHIFTVDIALRDDCACQLPGNVYLLVLLAWAKTAPNKPAPTIK